MTVRPSPLDRRATIWFAIVGGAATTLYLLVALAGSATGFGAMPSSFAAYAVSSVFSYTGHRALTFRSTAPHARTAPRFLSLTVAQYLLALAIPAIVTDSAGLPAIVSYVAVCVAAPLVSLVALSRFVFQPAADRHPAPLQDLTHG